MHTKTESVAVIYKDKKIVGIIQRDEITGHKILHRCDEMSIEEIMDIINHEKEEKVA